MIVPSLIFISSLIVSGLSTPVGNPVTISQVENDLAIVGMKTTVVCNDLTNFPEIGGNFKDIVQISLDCHALITSMETATADVKGCGMFDDPDAQSIIEKTRAFVPIMNDTIYQVVEKKSAFAAISPEVVVTVAQELSCMYGNTTALQSALMEAIPDEFLPPAEAIEKELDAIFQWALSAYPHYECI